MTTAAERRALVAARVREADPEISPAALDAALDAAAGNGRALSVLAAALEHSTEALASGAPGAVGRLVIELRARGSSLVEPRCARCGRAGQELIVSIEGGLCGRCRQRQLASACAVCGVVKPVAGRDSMKRPLCARCAPRPMRRCSRCGRIRPVARRAHDGEGEICDSCYKGPLAWCSRCGKRRPCNFATSTEPVCVACSPRHEERCSHCGQSRPPCARWPEGPVCEPCYRAALARRGRCESCGAERRLVHPPGKHARHCADCAGLAGLARCGACGLEDRPYRHGLCVRCALAERAAEVIGAGDGPLRPVYDAVIAAAQPYSAHNWLSSRLSGAILAEIASGTLELSHHALDAHSSPRAANFLRHVLVAHGVLPARDDALVGLEEWVTGRLGSPDLCAHAALLRSYGTWRVVRRARDRRSSAPRRQAPVAYAKICLNAAIAFCSFLEGRDTMLQACTQADLDLFAAEHGVKGAEVADFLDWAKTSGLKAGLSLSRPRRREGLAMDDEARIELSRRLLHDDSLEIADRVAGCLVLLYGQQLSRIVSMRRDQLSEHDGVLRLELGATRIDLVEPLAGLVRQLVSARRPKNGVTSPPSAWLFPGLDAGQHLNAAHLGNRLRRLGVRVMPGRRGALVYLAGRLPAAVLVDVLGIAPTTAVHWVQAAGGDWSTYAAQLVRERDREP